MTISVAEVARRFVDSYLGAQPDSGLKELFAAKVVHRNNHDPQGVEQEGARSAEFFVSIRTQARRMIPDYREEDLVLHVAQSSFIILTTTSGTLPDGSKLRIPSCKVFDVEGGQIVSINSVSDWSHREGLEKAFAAARKEFAARSLGDARCAYRRASQGVGAPIVSDMARVREVQRDRLDMPRTIEEVAREWVGAYLSTDHQPHPERLFAETITVRRNFDLDSRRMGGADYTKSLLDERARVRSLMPDFAAETFQLHVAENAFVFVETVSGTLPSGMRVRCPTCTVWDVEDGRITSVYVIGDRAQWGAVQDALVNV